MMSIYPVNSAVVIYHDSTLICLVVHSLNRNTTVSPIALFESNFYLTNFFLIGVIHIHHWITKYFNITKHL